MNEPGPRPGSSLSGRAPVSPAGRAAGGPTRRSGSRRGRRPRRPGRAARGTSDRRWWRRAAGAAGRLRPAGRLPRAHSRRTGGRGPGRAIARPRRGAATSRSRGPPEEHDADTPFAPRCRDQPPDRRHLVRPPDEHLAHPVRLRPRAITPVGNVRHRRQIVAQGRTCPSGRSRRRARLLARSGRSARPAPDRSTLALPPCRHEDNEIGETRMIEAFDLSGRVAIVTGGAHGIGREIVGVLAAAGAASSWRTPTPRPRPRPSPTK